MVGNGNAKDSDISNPSSSKRLGQKGSGSKSRVDTAKYPRGPASGDSETDSSGQDMGLVARLQSPEALEYMRYFVIFNSIFVLFVMVGTLMNDMAGVLVIQIFVAVGIMGWYGANVLRFVDDYFNSEFRKQFYEDHVVQRKGQLDQSQQPLGQQVSRDLKTRPGSKTLKRGNLPKPCKNKPRSADFSEADGDDIPGYFGTRDLSLYPHQHLDHDNLSPGYPNFPDSSRADPYPHSTPEQTQAPQKQEGTHDGGNKKAGDRDDEASSGTGRTARDDKLKPPPPPHSIRTIQEEQAGESGNMRTMGSQSQSHHPQKYEKGFEEEYYEVHHHRQKAGPSAFSPHRDQSIHFENLQNSDIQDEQEVEKVWMHLRQVQPPPPPVPFPPSLSPKEFLFNEDEDRRNGEVGFDGLNFNFSQDQEVGYDDDEDMCRLKA